MKNTSALQEKQDIYLKQNISNMIELSQKHCTMKFSFFLDERQQAVAESVLRHTKHSCFLFFGGTKNCERKMLAVSNKEMPEEKDFPISAVKISYNDKNEEVSHRDVLGSLMGLNIKREVIGDILTRDGYAVCFIHADIYSFVEQNLDKVKKTGVTVSLFEGEIIENELKYEEISGTVPSLRLDCIVAFLINKSRTIAVEKISAGLVKVNHSEVYSTSKQVNDGDIITIRGNGRFTIHSDNKRTKKDRLFITADKRI